MFRWKNEINENLLVYADKCIFQFFERFDELPFNMYQKINLKFDIKQFSATPTCINHILLAYLQCYIWCHYPFIKDIQMNPVKYGYKFYIGENLVPTIMT